MTLPRVLAATLVVGVLAAEACVIEETTTESEPTTTSSTTNTTWVPTTTTTTGAGGEAPLTCTQEYTNITGACDLLQQNCGEGFICQQSSSTGEATCLDGNGGLKGLGAPCDKALECRNGLWCVDGRCTPYCCPASDEPCGGGRCDVHLDMGDGYWVMACSYNLSCTLFAHDCPTGEECHISNRAQGLSVCDQPSPTPVGEGEPCEYRNDCGDSMVCNSSSPDVDPDAGVGGRCRYHCRVSVFSSLVPGSGGCLEGQSCIDMHVAALPDIGICKP